MITDNSQQWGFISLSLGGRLCWFSCGTKAAALRNVAAVWLRSMNRDPQTLQPQWCSSRCWAAEPWWLHCPGCCSWLCLPLKSTEIHWTWWCWAMLGLFWTALTGTCRHIRNYFGKYLHVFRFCQAHGRICGRFVWVLSRMPCCNVSFVKKTLSMHANFD